MGFHNIAKSAKDVANTIERLTCSATMEAISLSDAQVASFRKYIQCFDYKSENGEAHKYYCRVKGCKRAYKEQSPAIRHLQINHKPFHDLIHKNNEEKTESDGRITKDLRLKIVPEEIWDAVVELVTANSLPLSLVEYPAFKKIIGPYVSALNSQGYQLAMNNNGLKSRISGIALDIKNKIKIQVKGKMIGLMADIASRYNRSVLGVSISYSHGGEICVRTIACRVLKYSHTATYIHQVLEQILADYDIQLGQVISMTTDNGRNMVKAISYLDSSYQDSKEEAENCEEASDNDEFIDHSIFDDQYYDNLLTNLRSLFADTIHTDIIHGISCAAHCLHLIVTHAIEKTPAMESLIEKARKLAKRLRTPTLRAMMREAGLNMAKIDVVTRWNSAFEMVIYITCTQYVYKV